MRREDDFAGKRVMGMEVPGKRRPKRWLDNINNYLSERELSGPAAPEEAEASHKTHRPHIKVGKVEEEEGIINPKVIGLHTIAPFFASCPINC